MSESHTHTMRTCQRLYVLNEFESLECSLRQTNQNRRHTHKNILLMFHFFWFSKMTEKISSKFIGKISIILCKHNIRSFIPKDAKLDSWQCCCFCILRKRKKIIAWFNTYYYILCVYIIFHYRYNNMNVAALF